VSNGSRQRKMGFLGFFTAEPTFLDDACIAISSGLMEVELFFFISFNLFSCFSRLALQHFITTIQFVFSKDLVYILIVAIFLIELIHVIEFFFILLVVIYFIWDSF
jgi:uncharacterized membrane protein